MEIPFAAGVMNFIVLTAALSTMNANLYACTRMMFSLAQSDFAPRTLGKVNGKGIPLYSLIVSSFGLVVAVLLNLMDPQAYNTLFGISVFGGIFTWIIIFVTYFRFKRLTEHKISWVALLGFLLLSAILLTMWLNASWRNAVLTGILWLVFLSIAYVFGRRGKRVERAARDEAF
jgi:L-asparagine transporter-like permease